MIHDTSWPTNTDSARTRFAAPARPGSSAASAGPRPEAAVAEPVSDELPAYRYRAVATDANGDEIVEIFESNVEYLTGDELPLRSARWEVQTVEQDGIAHIDGEDQRVRELRCTLK